MNHAPAVQYGDKINAKEPLRREKLLSLMGQAMQLLTDYSGSQHVREEPRS
jgi:hypothetical protein